MATVEEMQAELERLKRENAQLKSVAAQGLRMKVSEKGGLSVYGLNARFPITLYPEQWLRLLDTGDAIRDFIEANRASLKWKSSEED
jgi:hypothetical protein